MPERPLEGVEAKLERAREHLDRLEADARTFLERKPYAIEVEYDAQIDMHVGKARSFEEPPLALSVIVGEFAYECISALNHAVWQLAARKRGRHKIEAIKEQIQFPVALSPESFKRKSLIKLGHVSKAAITIIDGLQPYYGWHGFQGDRHPLWLLKDMADTDKHRVLAPRWGSIRTGGVEWVLAEPNNPPRHMVALFKERPNQTLKDGTTVMGIRLAPDNVHAKVSVEGDLAPEIAFGAGDYMLAPGDIRLLEVFAGRCRERLATLF